jgi:multidrug efflux pump subunit AcrA (membrane-fusion protein)
MKSHPLTLKFALSAVALLSLVGGAFSVVRNTHTRPHEVPPASPPVSVFDHAIGAVGLVEPKSEDIAVAPVVPGLVTAVRVRAQQHVRAGDELWSQDSRDLAAQIPVREAEVTTARAAISVAENALADAQVQLNTMASVTDRRAIREEELERRRIAVESAKAQLAVSRAARTRAVAALAETRTNVSRRVVTAPIDGEILKVNVRPGEYAEVPATSPLVVMGDTATMHVRADVAEEDVSRFAPEARAYASPRGDSIHRIALAFVRLEPRLIPKRNLTGDTAERIDTRVLQVIYRIAGQELVYDGELMDVFIEAATVSAGSRVLSPTEALRGSPSDQAVDLSVTQHEGR